jgi:anti-sigma factor RsiW
MNHQHNFELLSRYADGEVSDAERSHMERSLAECPVCRERFQQISTLRAGIRGAGDYELPSTFTSDLLRTIRSRDQVFEERVGVERFAWRVVLALSLLVIVVVGYSNVSQPEPVVTVDRVLEAEAPDSLTRRVIEPQHELSKDDIVFAAISK